MVPALGANEQVGRASRALAPGALVPVFKAVALWLLSLFLGTRISVSWFLLCFTVTWHAFPETLRAGGDWEIIL